VHNQRRNGSAKRKQWRGNISNGISIIEKPAITRIIGENQRSINIRK